MDRLRLWPLRGSHPLRPLPASPGVRSVRTQPHTSEVSEQVANGFLRTSDHKNARKPASHEGTAGKSAGSTLSFISFTDRCPEMRNPNGGQGEAYIVPESRSPPCSLTPRGCSIAGHGYVICKNKIITISLLVKIFTLKSNGAAADEK
ncbi:hypothetical protein E5288_WYG006681 [Bos mutus]|uniref:Uncharacterized protein n=1 Tax=Bos mutus TaxID=72004 RepID=A0A6B0RIJ1_9CETA|nr:hypothetical protein [Bos mutus]